MQSARHIHYIMHAPFNKIGIKKGKWNGFGSSKAVTLTSTMFIILLTIYAGCIHAAKESCNNKY